jgi:N-acetylglucosamine kinase-like BadF-type ATPase
VSAENPVAPRLPELDTPSLLLGIDGGGTKTTALLAVYQPAAAPRAIGRGVSGPSNARSSGWETAKQNIAQAISAAFAAAGRTSERVAALCLGMAGAGHASVRAELHKWCAQQQQAARWLVVHDAQTILRAGAQQGPAVALISGTGSLAYGGTADGHSARAGGWGHLLGDEGSGYAIGIAALRAIARATDGRGPATQLAASLLTQLGLHSPWDLIPLLHEDREARYRIASLAPLVLAAATEDDAVAQHIQGQAAEELSGLVAAVAQSLAFADRNYHLVFSGGLLQHQPALRDAVLRQLAEQHAAPQSSTVVEDPAYGAVLLAGDLLA